MRTKAKKKNHVAKKKNHVGMGGTGMRCLNCGTEESVHYPVRIGVLKAIGTAFEREHKNCKPSEAGRKRFEFATPDEWIRSWDTGISSKVLWTFFTGRGVAERCAPHDPDDFGRCYRLLKAFPEWRARLFEVGETFSEWSPLVLRWVELESLYEQELPTGGAPKLYALIQKLRGVTS